MEEIIDNYARGKNLRKNFEDMIYMIQTKPNNIHIWITKGEDNNKIVEIKIINNKNFTQPCIIKNVSITKIRDISLSIDKLIDFIVEFGNNIMNDMISNDNKYILKHLKLTLESLTNLAYCYIVQESGNGYILYEIPEEYKNDERVTENRSNKYLI